MMDRPMTSRQRIAFPLTDAFIDANSMETMEVIDNMDVFYPRFLTLWT